MKIFQKKSIFSILGSVGLVISAVLYLLLERTKDIL